MSHSHTTFDISLTIIGTSCVNSRWCSQDLVPVVTRLEEESNVDQVARENWELVMKSNYDP